MRDRRFGPVTILLNDRAGQDAVKIEIEPDKVRFWLVPRGPRIADVWTEAGPGGTAFHCVGPTGTGTNFTVVAISARAAVIRLSHGDDLSFFVNCPSYRQPR